MNKKVVVFGGGTGISFLLRGLKNFPVDITAIITVSDDGSSTGKLREEFLMPAMGDIRNAIVSLSDANDKIKDLLQYRFDTYTDLNGHPIGNLIMVAMYNMTGSLKEIHCEIEIGHSGKRIKKLYYDEDPLIDKEVIEEILSADLIIFSIGSLFTSIIPNLLSSEVIAAIDKSNAKLLYTCNAVCQMGETEDFTAADHVATINNYLGKRKLDAVIVADSNLPKNVLDKYISSENKKLVKCDTARLKELGCKVIKDDLLVIENNYIRHDNLKFATCIFNYLMRW